MNQVGPSGDEASAPVTALVRGLGRDEALALGAIAAATGLAWLWLSKMNGGAPTAGPAMDAMMMAATETFTLARAGMTFVMWAVMMVAMMLPSAAPIVLLHRRLAIHNQGAAGAIPPVSLLVLGYVLVWAGFSLVATSLQMVLAEAGLLTAMAALADQRLAGGMLILAGLYQLTPLKQQCLRLCRSPVAFLMQHYRPGPGGALRMGLGHGAYCVGCCWAAMALLFVGGVMNFIWIVALAIFVLIERLLPRGRRAGLVLGGLAALGGVYLIVLGR